MGGFECSAHRRMSGRRVDVIDATRHDHFADADYHRLAASGLCTARDGLRWPLIERVPGQFEFASASAQVEASRAAGVQVIWDLLHYGVPDHVDVLAPDFPARFARYAQACATFLADGDAAPLWLCPVNEISFFAWGGGQVAYLPPFMHGQGDRLKRALVRAVIAGMDAVRSAVPQARFIHAEPMIAVTVHPERPHEAADARTVHASQFEALDMLAGRISPELGGGPRYLDVIGVNYYPYNQWRHHPDHGQRIVLPPTHPEYRPLRTLLDDVAARYDRPLLIAETGAEDEARAPWFAMVAREALAARAAGVPVHGVCVYPVVNHPGWDDDRHCHNGLWDYPDAAGHRAAYEPLALALNEARRWEADGVPDCEHGRVSMSAAELSHALGRAAGVASGEAAARDADGAFPTASIASLREVGLLGAPLAVELGGTALAGLELLRALRGIGRANLSVARLYEGHVNALLLVSQHGTPEQVAALAADVRGGHLGGVWNTEDRAGLRLEHAESGWTLRGGKTFTSGAQGVTRAVVTAELPDGGGRQLLLLPDLPAARFDGSFWTPLGMRASVSARLNLDGLPVSAEAFVGPPGVYYAQPGFGAGALRFLAAQLGGADALVEAARAHLGALGRAADTVQALRFAEVAGRLEGAWQVVVRGEQLAASAADTGTVLAYVALARSVTEDACLLAAEATERAVGARGLLDPHPVARLLRDLRMYLRQPAPDAARAEAGAWVLGRTPLQPEELSLWPGP